MPAFVQRLVFPHTCSGHEVIVSLQLPAGSYIVSARATVRAIGTSPIYTAVLSVGQGMSTRRAQIATCRGLPPSFPG